MYSIRQLNEADAVQLEAWLRRRLGDAYGDDRRASHQALCFLDLGIEGVDTMAQGLKLLYRKLAPPAQETFVAAVGHLFRHARPRDFPVEGMQDLMVLIAATDAHHHLTAYESVLGSGIWGEQIPELFFYAISSLKTLGNGPEAGATARKLVGCRFFPAGYLFDAYEVMLASCQERWDEDLLLVAPGLEQLRSTLTQPALPSSAHQTLERRFGGLAQHIVRLVTPERISEGLRKVTSRLNDALSREHALGRLVMRLSEYIRVDLKTNILMIHAPGAKIPMPLIGLSEEATFFIRNVCSRAIPIPELPPKLTRALKNKERQRRQEQAEAAIQQIQGMLWAISPPPELHP